MSFYGSGYGGWLVAGDIIVTIRNDVQQTGQKLLLCDGSTFDGTEYPELEIALGGTTLPHMSQTGIRYMVVADNAVMPDNDNRSIKVAVYAGGETVITALTNSNFTGTGGGGEDIYYQTTVQPSAGDIIVTSADFLDDGRNLLPCDGSLVTTDFPELIAAMGGSLKEMKFDGCSNPTYISEDGLSFVAGNDTYEYAWCKIPESGKHSVEFDLSATSGNNNAQYFGMYDTADGSEWTGAGDASPTNRQSIHAASGYVTFGGTAWEGFYPPEYPQSGPKVNRDQRVAYVFDCDAKTYELYINGVLRGASSYAWATNPVVAFSSGANGYVSNIVLTVNGSNNGFDYGIKEAVLPDYRVLDIPYKMVAQPINVDGIGEYVHVPDSKQYDFMVSFGHNPAVAFGDYPLGYNIITDRDTDSTTTGIYNDIDDELTEVNVTVAVAAGHGFTDDGTNSFLTSIYDHSLENHHAVSSYFVTSDLGNVGALIFSGLDDHAIYTIEIRTAWKNANVNYVGLFKCGASSVNGDAKNGGETVTLENCLGSDLMTTGLTVEATERYSWISAIRVYN